MVCETAPTDGICFIMGNLSITIFHGIRLNGPVFSIVTNSIVEELVLVYMMIR